MDNQTSSGRIALDVYEDRVRDALEREGYAVVPFFSFDELHSLRSLYEQGVDEHASGAFAWRNLREEPTAPNEKGEREVPLSALPQALRTAAERAFSGHRIIESIFLTKLPHGASYALHQHPPLTEEPFGRTYVCWCPMAHADAKSGTLMVVPGSHRLYNYVRLSDEGEFFAAYRDELSNEHAVTVPVRAGEAVIFDNNLIHGSSANTTGTPRTAVIAAILPAASHHCVYKREPSGEIAVLYDGDDSYKMVIEPGQLALRPAGEVVRRLPAWNRKARFDEFRKLLKAGRRADEQHDPLVELCGEEQHPTDGAKSEPVVFGGMARAKLNILITLAPFVPEPVKALRRRLIRRGADPS